MTLLRARRPGRTRLRVPDGLPTNVYNRPENVARVDLSAARTPVRSIARAIARPAQVPNDVFAGKNGKVYRRDPEGTWQVREGTAWKPTKLPSPPPAPPRPEVREPTSRPSTRPSQPEVPPQRERPSIERPAPPSTSPTPGDLEREYRARQRSGQGKTQPLRRQPLVQRPTARNLRTRRRRSPRGRNRRSVRKTNRGPSENAKGRAHAAAARGVLREEMRGAGCGAPTEDHGRIHDRRA